MLSRLVGENIAIVTRLTPFLGRVLADPGQLHQVLMNLAVNARDAMPDGGKLVIETANVDIDESYVAAHTEAHPGPFVQLTVADTGVGMDEATRQRAFEPFFTTKSKGVGTGLGLSTVYGIIKQSGGWILMYTEPGQGTIFRVYLPRVSEPAERPLPVSPVASLQGAETILVVEDQPAVRKLTADILKRYGYDVLEVANGAEALLLSERFHSPIHVMVTDVIMPGMTGRELASRLATLRPDMKVLFISGYAGDIITHQGVLDSDVAFLSKPFAPDALAGKLRELLDAAPR
jgi:CheY-like chemotaxis protein